MPAVEQRLDLHQCVQGTPLPAVGVLLRWQIGLEDGLKHHQRCHLRYTIPDRWDAQRSQLAIRFGYKYPPHGSRPIRLGPEFLRQFVEPPAYAVLLDVLERLPIHPGCTGVGLAAQVGIVQHVPAGQLVVQAVEPEARLGLRFGM
jgi:hypothetical protein